MVEGYVQGTRIYPQYSEVRNIDVFLNRFDNEHNLYCKS